MTGLATEKVWPYWTGAAVTAGLILAAVPFARPVQKALETRSKHAVLAVITAGFLVIGIAVFRRLVWKPSEGKWRRVFFFGAVCGVYVWRLSNLSIIVERFHLLEYGTLAVLTALACSRRNLGIVSLGWAVWVTILTGLADELFQFYRPERVGEWRDVLINLESGLLGLAALCVLAPSRSILGRSNRRSWIRLLAGFSLISVLSGMFVLKVQVFGYEHDVPGIGRFRSFFPLRELEVSTVENYRQFLDKLETGDDVRPGLFIEKYWYEREAKEHFDRTRLLWEQENFSEAVLEYRITMRYFHAFLEIRGWAFPTEIVEGVTRHEPVIHPEHLSRVVNWMIVAVNRRQVIWLTWLTAAVFALGAAAVAASGLVKSGTGKRGLPEPAG